MVSDEDNAMRKMIISIIAIASMLLLSAGTVFAQETDMQEIMPAGEYAEHDNGHGSNYEYMFDAESVKKADIPLEQVKHIAVLFTSAPLPQSLFLDMEELKSYYDPSKDIYFDIKISKYISDMDEDEIAAVRDIWTRADFENWEFSYEGSMELDYECHLSIETENGIYHYVIKGVDAAAPDSLTFFISELLHAFWNPQVAGI